MSLNIAIKDCKKVFNFLFSNSFNHKKMIDPCDLALLSLLKSIIGNLSSIECLIKDEASNHSIYILLRSFLEQTIYFDYLFQNKNNSNWSNKRKRQNIILRGNSLFFYQRINLFKKINHIKQCDIDFNIDTLIKKSEIDDKHQSLDDIIKYYKQRYEKLFLKNKKYVELSGKEKRKRKKYWYNVDGDDYNSLKDLAGNISYKEVYLLYNLYSDYVHGHTEAYSIWIEHYNDDIYINSANLLDDEGILNTLTSCIYIILDNLIWFYNIKDSDIKEILMRKRINIKLKKKVLNLL